MIARAVTISLAEIGIGLGLALFVALLVCLIARGQRNLPAAEPHAGKVRVGIDRDWNWPAR